MIVEILATGDEITSGAVIDSNSAFIASLLEESGYPVKRHSAVADSKKELSSLFTEIAGRADLALVTGGLGPTVDDITAEAAALSAGVCLAFDRQAMACVENFFKRRNLPYNNLNDKQARLPAGATSIDNPFGTAPGFHMEIAGCRFIFMPGVPYEMEKMMGEKILPLVDRLSGKEKKVNLLKNIATFGLPESVVNGKVATVSDQFPSIKLGLRAKFPEIQVKLYACGDDAAALSATLEAATAWVLERLGKNAFSTEGDSLEAAVGKLLAGKKATLAVAESCTGGLIGHLVTDVAGSSDYFLFSGITYANEAKINILGVNPKTIEKHGAVHEETAREMAEGARRISGADYAVSTTGIAGPGGGSEDKPVGTVCIGFASRQGSRSRRFNFTFRDRGLNKLMFAKMALEFLRRELSCGGTAPLF